MMVQTVASLDEVRSAIRQELQEQGLFQKDLALWMGVSEKHISQMLNGRAGITIPALLDMCLCLHMSVALVKTTGKRSA